MLLKMLGRRLLHTNLEPLRLCGGLALCTTTAHLALFSLSAEVEVLSYSTIVKEVTLL
jgi:hypothetical protein